MKMFLVAVVLVMQGWVGNDASAAPCTTATLASYQALGSTGCTIGSLNFASFGMLTEPTAASPFTAITLAPVTTGAFTGFRFEVAPAAAANAQLFENLISYRVAGTVDSASIDLAGFGASGDGAVTNVQNLCLAGFFAGIDGVSGCTGTALDQIAIAIDGFSDAAQVATFLSVASLAVVTDIAIDGGGNGLATLASTTNLFRSVAIAAVPEPTTILLLGAGLIGFALRSPSRRRRVA